MGNKSKAGGVAPGSGHELALRTDPRTIGELGEQATIAEITAVAPSTTNGDDAAVLLNAPPNTRTVATTDLLVEGRHFRLGWSTPEEVGHKAIVQNFADIEAMGARPVAALLGISAPTSTPIEVVRGIARGIEATVEEFSAELVGGDLVGGDTLVLSVTALGSLGGSRLPLTLGGAKAGQRLVAAGAIGESAAGLALLERYGRAVPPELVSLRDAHTRPTLRPARGMVARATGATAATDNSDGLIVDLTTLARRSQVAIDLHGDAIRPGEKLRQAAQLLGVDPWEWVLTGGEDHTILVTTSGDIPSGFREIGRVDRFDTAATTTGAPRVTIDGRPPRYASGWTSF